MDLREQHGELSGQALPGPHLVPVPVCARAAEANRTAVAAVANARLIPKAPDYVLIMFPVSFRGVR